MRVSIKVNIILLIGVQSVMQNAHWGGDAIGHTGDSANMFAWVLLMLASEGAITVFYFKKRIVR